MVYASPKTYVFDLDGVIYRGNEPQPHASETLRELRHRGRRVFFLTNNSASSRKDYLTKLSGMGVDVSHDEIMTSGYATALYLKENGGAGKRAFVVGGAGLEEELTMIGIEVFRNRRPTSVDYVVVGLDREFTYEKLTWAHHAILSGAEFIATNCDATYPIEDGVIIPGGGSLVSAIQTATGTAPLVIGKPETYALVEILHITGSTPTDTVIIGDRLETDILLGSRMGTHTVLPLTGVTTEKMASEAPLEMRPQRVIRDLIELLDEPWDSR